MTQKHSYSIFQEPWWLDATAPGAWDCVQIESGGHVAAKLPFVVQERRGARILTQPALTQSLGPWIADTGAGYSKTLSREMSLYRELIKGLPKHDLFKQHFAPEVTNWLPFYWEGFTQTTRYTYLLDIERGLDAIRSNMDKRNRRQLAHSQNFLQAEVSDDLNAFLLLNDKTFQRQGMQTPYSHEYVHRLDDAVQRHAKRWIILARDKATGTAQAGIYMISDGTRVYSLMSGADPDARAQNGGIVARWKAIETVHTAGLPVLDLQGSMIKNVERRNRNYGAEQVPYFSIMRSNGRLERAERNARWRRAPLLWAWRMKQSLKRGS